MHHEMTNANIPQENGVAEHLNRTILEMTRAMLFESKLPKSFRTFAVNYTRNPEQIDPHRCYLTRRLLTKPFT